MNEVPASLRIWFLIHFAVDMVFAFSLLVAPAWVLGLFSFAPVEPFTARLVGAALAGIGGVSFFARHGSAETYDALLTLKLLWSAGALLAIVLSLVEGGPRSLWLFFGIFFCFFLIWALYKARLRRH
jgi:hypothetical protein